MADEKIKIPPHSKESEMMVLGCMLTNINSLNAGADTLDESDFYFSEHRTIFSALQRAFKSDRPADVHLICEELKRQGKLEGVGGAAYVTALAQYAGTSAYLEEYADLVTKKSILRRMIQAAQTVEHAALEEPDDVASSLDDAQQLFFQISQRANPANGRLISEILSGIKTESQLPFLKELEARQERYRLRGPDDPGVTGIPTGLIDLDKLINGLNPSNLMIVAGRPAMGKTAIALNMASHVCFKQGTPVGIFSLEMSAEQLVHRLVCSQAEVESDKIITGSLGGVEYQRIVQAVNEMRGHTLVIDDQPGLKITDLRARARRMKEAYSIGFLVIDYLQLLSGSSSARNMESRQNEISEISRMLKNLARELNIPVLCAAQLSRKVEERQGHRPMLSDLRESGCLGAESVIVNADTGERYTIQELAAREVQEPIPVHAVNGDWKIERHLMTRVFPSGRKRLYELRTASGRTIRASGNHPFLKLEGWTRLEALAPGDRIALPRILRVSPDLNQVGDKELILLAHLIGDGCILPEQPYHYTSADPMNLEIVEETAKDLFGIQPRRVAQKNWFHVYLPSPYRMTHGRHHPITCWYHRLGLDRVRSYEKRLPRALFNCSSQAICLFLKHLWATDGNVSWKRIKGRKPVAAIYYGTTSPTLALQVQHLLLRLAIPSCVRRSPSTKGRDSYNVHIDGVKNQKRFLTDIGCYGKRGEIIPQLLVALEEVTPNPHADAIPKEAWHLFVKPEKEQAGIGWRTITERLNMSYCGTTLYKAAISRERMARLSTACNNSLVLNKLATSDIFWDVITSITEGEEEEVFDATVPGVHNFVANDIIVHNSIEQDSDVVLLLMRRDYYDPLDKPGMAEVIIAKNRHGAVGNVNLTYKKEIGRFVNHTPVQVDPSALEELGMPL